MHEDGPPVPFKAVTYLLFVVFFVLVSVITLNLLVGLTVDDIKTFLDEADLKNLQLKLKYVLGIEKTYTNMLRRNFKSVKNFKLFRNFSSNARIQNLT